MASSEIDDPEPKVVPTGDFARHFETFAHGAEPVSIADPDLVFTGAYSRDGFDLTISRPFESLTVHDYFRDARRPSIVTSGGASLSGAVVSAMTTYHGGERYAADSAAAGAPKAIGRVEIVTGAASAVRNGQTLTLHAGDLVYKGDAVETSDHSSLALTFLDGTAFTLSADARMVLNDMVYEPTSATNSALLTLVQGSIGFVAGNVAHTGEMKVDTPVATMGIRGTAVHVVIDADRGRTHFSVMREPNGRVGSYVLYDHQDPDHILATISDVTLIVTLELVNGVVEIETDQKTDADYSDELNLTQFAFQVFQIGQDHPLRTQLGLDQPGGPGPNHPSPNSGGGGPGSSVPPTDSAPPPGNPETHAAPAYTPQFPPPPTPSPPTFGGASGSQGSQASAETLAPPLSFGGGAIQVETAPSGGVVGAASSAVAINLLGGVVDSDPSAKVNIATNAAGEPAVTVSVVSGVFDPAAVKYAVDSAGALHVDPSQFSSVAPGTTLTLAFDYTLVDSTGATKPVSALLTIDGGPEVVYPSPAAGHGAVTVTPTIVSPEGGNSFTLVGTTGPGLAETGAFGTAAIDPATGAITYTPSAPPGTAGVDRFTVADTDSLGVTTDTTAAFSVDGGAALHYAQATVAGAAVSEAPSLTSPEGGDRFAFSSASGLAAQETGALGTASIDPTTGVILYTPSAAPGKAGEDSFLVSDTDADGVTTTTTAVFAVDGGTLVHYATSAVGQGAIVDAPTLTSPEGGDRFALASASGLAGTETGAFGTASIDAATGVIAYTPSAAPGTAGEDTFIVADADALGVVTHATAAFAVDGGTAVNYAAATVIGSAVTAAPTLTSPEGGDRFAFSDLSASETGAFGTAAIDPTTGVIAYTPSAAPGEAGEDTFIVTDADALGVVTHATAAFAVDGGTAVGYAATKVIGSAVTAAPTLNSPEGGDRFAFSGLSSSETGAFGTATIDPTTGVIAYTPSAAPGTAGEDAFTVLDTDALGATTTANAVFAVDGGTAASYAAANVIGSPVTVTPTLTSPEGGDRFAFSDLSASETGAFGTAAIDPTTGVIAYTPSAPPGKAGEDAFIVLDTDSLGATTTTSADFAVDGGTAVAYARATALGTAVATDTPTLTSPEGGDRFAFSTASGLVSELAGTYGTASIDAATGVIAYAPSAPRGTGGVDTFTISDTDALGATTTTQAVFDVDGGADDSYGVVHVGRGAATSSPTVSSPEGGDRFAFQGPTGLLASEAGEFGTATIDATTGVITYTPSAAPGTSGADAFTVADTDALGLTTTTIAEFIVDGGALANYVTTVTTGASPASSTPTLVSPNGGDSFALESEGVAARVVTGNFGTASIASTTGVITYTPSASAPPGSAETDAFTVSDTDALGVTTTATAAFVIDGGSAVTYAATEVGARGVMVTPSILSPEGGDRFAFEVGAGVFASSAVGDFGTATIDPTSGVIAYTPNGAVAAGALTDAFTVVDTDADGARTTTIADFNIDPGSSFSYPPENVGRGSVAVGPILSSPVGGDSFSFGDGSLTASDPNGTATISPTTGVITFTPTLPPAAGSTALNAFQVQDTDALGVTTSATAAFAADGGPLVTYAPPATVGATPVTDTPTVASPEGGDSFAFILPAGAGEATTEAGAYGTAVIDASTGAITFTASAANAPGVLGEDMFQVIDTDALGVSAQPEVHFQTDTGTALSYGATPTVLATAPVIDAPTLHAPVGGDEFAFALSGEELSPTDIGAFGSATIAATTGAVTYTAFTPTPGVAGADTFTVVDTDGLGVRTSTSVSFFVDGGPLITAPTVTTLPEGTTSAIAGVGLTETGALDTETFTVTLSDAHGLLSASGAGVSGDDSTSLTIHGPLTVVDAALDKLMDTNSAGGEDTITLRADDNLGGLAAAREILTEPPTQDYVWDVGSGTWNSASGADWNPPGDGTTPTSGSDVTIGSGVGGTVTLAQAETVNSLAVTDGYLLDSAFALTTTAQATVAAGGEAALAALTVGGALTVDGEATFTGALSSVGAITVDAGGSLALTGGAIDNSAITGAGVFETTPGGDATLSHVTISDDTLYTASDNATTAIAGAIDDNGTIDLIGGADQNGVMNLVGAVTLSGDGALKLIDDADASGYGGSLYLEGDGETLTISGGTIEGTGLIGNGNLAIDNAGVIDATPEAGPVTLTLDNSGGIVNAGGLLEATGGGTLAIDQITVDNASGTIAVGDASSTVELLNAAVEGGTLSISAGGTMETAGATTLDGGPAAGALTIEGAYTASNDAATDITGDIVIDGTMDLVGGADSNGIVNLVGAATLTGLGAFVMTNHPDDSGYGGSAYLEGDGETLTNSGGGIEGAGIIGNGSLALTNDSVIDATPEGGGSTLTLNNSGGIVNSGGVLEANGGGVLAIQGVIVSNQSGSIVVGDASSTVQLAGAIIRGGALLNTAGGVMETISAATLDGSTTAGALTIEGVYAASDNTTTTLAGSIVDNGTIDLAGGADQNGIVNLAADVALTGDGALVMDDQPDGSGYGGAAYLEGNDHTLTNSDLIEGTGVIGNGNLTLINKATIDATPEGNPGTLTLDNSGGITNAGGTLEATLGGILSISGIAVNNAKGEILVGDKASDAQIVNATIQGGLLDDSAGGTLATSGASTLDGSTAAGAVTIEGVYTASDNASTTIAGTIAIAGALDLIGGADANGFVILGGDVTLTGSGALVMIDHPDDSGYGGAAYLQGNGETLTNSGGGIEGTGTIGDGSLALINQATIDATPEGNSQTLTLDNSGGVANDGGLLEATDDGILSIVAIAVKNAGGAITVGGEASTVDLLGATIEGGILNNTLGGAMVAYRTTTLDGETSGAVTINGVFTVSDSSQINIKGVIVDSGAIDLLGGADQDGIVDLVGATSLTGAGALTMISQPDDSGYGGAAYLEGNGETLTNSVLIEGTGIIGDGSLGIVNGGVIEATPEDDSVMLTLDGSGAFLNANGDTGGVLEAIAGATLSIASVTVDNAGGEIIVGDASSMVQVVNTTIQGGTLNNLAGGTLETSGTSTLDGSAAGALTIEGVYAASNNAVTDIEGAIVIDGSIELIGGADSNGIVNLVAGATLSGSGVLEMINHPDDSGYGGAAYLEGNGETLTNSGGGIEGTGIIGDGSLALTNASVIDATPEGGASTLTLNGSGGVVNTGTLEATGGGLLVVDSPLSGAGGITVGAGSTVELGVASNETATFAGANATLKLDAPSSYSGDIAGFAADDTLYLSGVDATSATPSADGADTTLTVTLSGGGSLSYTLIGDYVGYGFDAAPSGADSLVTLSAARPSGVPVIAAPATLAATQGSEEAIANVGLSEAGALAGEIFKVTVSDTHGLLSATGPDVTGSGTTELIIRGSLADVKAALLTLEDTDNVAGPDTINLTGDDNFGNQAVERHISANVTALTPAITAPTAATVELDLATAMSGVSLSESGASHVEKFMVTMSDTYGLLSATGPGVTGSGTTALQITGTLVEVNDALATLKDTDGENLSDTVSLTARDGFGNVAAGASFAVDPVDGWINKAGGDWSVGGDWSAGAAPNLAESAEIGIAGASLTVTVTTAAAVADLATAANATLDITSGSLTIEGAGASTIAGRLENSGTFSVDDGVVEIGAGGVSNFGTIEVYHGTLELVDGETLATGGLATIILDSSGTIEGGVIRDSGGGVQFLGGTLEGVTYDGTLTIQESGSLFVDDGLTATGAGGTGTGAITLGADAAIYLDDTVTLNSAMVTLGFDASLDSYTTSAAYVANNDQPPSETLTLGSGLTIDATGADAIGSAGYGGADDTIVNAGTINVAATSGYTTTVDPGQFVNEGGITVASGAVLTIDPTDFDNRASGTVTVASGGALTIGAAESSGTYANEGTITADQATVTFVDFGAFTTTGTVTIANSTVELQGEYATARLALFAGHDDAIEIAGALENAGATLNSNVFGSLALESDGTIHGGVIEDSGGAIQFSDGVLDDVTYEGTLAIPEYDMVRVDDALTAAGPGAGAITLGVDASIYVDDTLTLDNATMTLAFGAILESDTTYAAYAANGYTPPVETLTLGAGLTIDATDDNTISSAGYGGADDTIVNEGVINIEASTGYTTTIDPGHFVNEGAITVASGAILTIDPTEFDNSAQGTITVASGGSLSIGSDGVTSTYTNEGAITADGATVTFADFAAFTTTGTLAITNSTVDLQGDYATAPLALFAGRGDAIQIEGALDNAGATLNASGFASITLESNGTIQGGVIDGSGGDLQFSDGVLDGVTYAGTLAIQQYGAVHVADALTAGGGGAGVITLGIDSSIYVDDTLTLDNATMTLAFGAILESDTTYAAYAANGYMPPVETLTLGAGLTIDATNDNVIASAGYGGADDTIVNEGAINVEVSTGYTSAIDPGHFVNEGAISVASGAILSIDPTEFDNSAQGTITVASGGSLSIGSDGDASTYTNEGAITADQATVTFANFGAFTTSTTLAITNSTVDLQGDYATAPLALFAGRGDSIQIEGALNNAGATLNASAFASITLESNGMIQGGVIADSGGGLQFSGGVLDDAIYQGTLAIQQYGSLYVDDGLTATGANGVGSGTITLGVDATLALDNSQELDDATVTLDFGAYVEQSTTYAAYLANNEKSPTETLTLGSRLTIDATDDNLIGSGGYYGADDSIVNDGVINVEASSGYTTTIDPSRFVNEGAITVASGAILTIDPIDFDNGASGTITVSSGGALTLGVAGGSGTYTDEGKITADQATVTFANFGAFTPTGTVAVTNSTVDAQGAYGTAALALFAGDGDAIHIDGALDNAGAALNAGGFASITVESVGTIQGGVIQDTGGGLLFSYGTLIGVTYEGTLAIQQSGLLYVDDGLTATGANGAGAGTITLGVDATLELDNTQTLDHATMTLGFAASLEQYTAYGAWLANNDSPPPETLTLGSQLSVYATGDNAIVGGGYGGAGDDTIISEGAINVEASPYATTIEPTHFVNDGAIDVASGGSLTIESATYENDGALRADGAVTVVSPVTGAGSAAIGAGGVLEFEASVAAGQTISFAGATGTLHLDDPADFGGTIAAMSGAGDVLDLKGFNAAQTSAITGAGSYNGVTTTLTVHDSSDGTTMTFALAGDYSASNWTVTPDASQSGVDIVDPPSGAPIIAAAASAAGAISEIFLGAAGGDTFVFKPNMGNAVIADFQADAARGPTDLVNLEAFHFADYQALLRETTDTPSGEVIALDGHSLTLEGVHAAQLHASLFLL